MSIALTIIIPCYNEERGIGGTIEKLLPVAKNQGWEILIVNDGSTDSTAKVVANLEGVRVIHQKHNKGYGASLKAGILAAETEYIAFYDADGQHQPDDLLKLSLEAEKYDMIVGARGKSSHQDWQRKPGKWVLSKFANFLTGEEIPDLNSGLRIVQKNEIEPLLHLFPNGFSFSTTSTMAFMNMGFSVKYIGIKVEKRVGKSTVKQLKHGSSTLLLMLRLMVLFNPLRVFLPVSFFFIGTGLLYQIGFGIYTLQSTGKIVIFQGSTLLLVAGLLMFFFGLMTDQISEVRKHQFLKI
ncbi:MAG: glycosyltransferase involved in cell wall biosynthesis [Algoriphagus sp.]|jgi:glycosyltransferase involved in cell wall biosynthesis